MSVKRRKKKSITDVKEEEEKRHYREWCDIVRLFVPRAADEKELLLRNKEREDEEEEKKSDNDDDKLLNGSMHVSSTYWQKEQQTIDIYTHGHTFLSIYKYIWRIQQTFS